MQMQFISSNVIIPVHHKFITLVPKKELRIRIHIGERLGKKLKQNYPRYKYALFCFDQNNFKEENIQILSSNSIMRFKSVNLPY